MDNDVGVNYVPEYKGFGHDMQHRNELGRQAGPTSFEPPFLEVGKPPTRPWVHELPRAHELRATDFGVCKALTSPSSTIENPGAQLFRDKVKQVS